MILNQLKILLWDKHPIIHFSGGKFSIIGNVLVLLF
jgi:hypothetical protein